MVLPPEYTEHPLAVEAYKTGFEVRSLAVWDKKIVIWCTSQVYRAEK